MDYFTRIPAHIQGDMDFDAVTLNDDTLIVSLGSDDLITWRSLSGGSSDTLELEPDHGFSRVALHPQGGKFLVGGPSRKVCEYSIATKALTAVIDEPLGTIIDVKYSPTGRFVSIATQEQKSVLFDTTSNRKTKCRPGHTSRVLNTFFSPNDEFVASIGEDCTVLVYAISAERDPHEVFRAKFTSELPSLNIQGCFAHTSSNQQAYVPGTNSLQVVEQLASRWEMKKTQFGHATPIHLVQSLSSRRLATCCSRDLYIWAVDTQEKLAVFEDYPMNKIVAVVGTFIGCRNDGALYCYSRPYSEDRKETIEEEDASVINFNNEQDEEKIELEYENQEQEEEQVDHYKHASKKRIADKLIKVYPQPPLRRATDFFDENRFAYMNSNGFIIQTRENEEISTYVEFRRRDGREVQPKLLFRGQQYHFYGLNKQFVCYANQNQFGMKIDKFSSWQKTWFDIRGVALSGHWMAVANLSEIKFLDISGNQIKSVSFDRPIISMEAYENLLVVVYHESVPLYESQMLGMKIFTVNQADALPITQTHVPLTTPQQGSKGSTLKWFGFSTEGMLFSEDSVGVIRAYSLEANQWTPVLLQGLDNKKIWMVGVEDYQAIFWRITDAEPEPTVRPRLNLKSASMAIWTLHENLDELEPYPSLLWKRYCLDHEMARWRLWGHHKSNRNDKHINFELSATIKNEKIIYDEHLNLDVLFYPIIKFFIKAEQTQRALSLVKNHIRSMQAAKNLIDLFDQCGYRNLAIDLEYFYEQKQRQIEYETLQQLALKELMAKVEVSVKPKKENPMNPKYKPIVKDTIRYHVSSQPSQNSSIMEDITHKSSENSKAQEPFVNPFLKKKTTDDRRLQIEEHIEKYGVKRKADQKRKSK